VRMRVLLLLSGMGGRSCGGEGPDPVAVGEVCVGVGGGGMVLEW